MWHLKEIPRIVHLYWSGRLSYLRYLTLESLRLHNPDWKIILYKPLKPQPIFHWHSEEQLYGDNYIDCSDRIGALDIRVEEVDFGKIGFDNNAHEVHKSDFLRWRLLHEVGGVWADMDILFIKPLDDIYFNKPYMSKVNTVVCINKEHSIGFLMGSKGNEYYKALHQASLREYRKEGYQSIGSLLCGKLFPTLSSICSANTVPYNLPMEIVYAYNSLHVEELFINEPVKDRISASTIGLHWYGGHKASGAYMNNYNGGLRRGGVSIIDRQIEAIHALRKPVERPSNPTLSIVMAFYNRQALLDKTIESIKKSAVKDYELIIVDDASAIPLKCDIAKVIRVEKKDKWYNCSAVAWNRGLREAKGDIILMQSPECYHAGDVMKYAVDNIKPNEYLSFGCYAINKEETIAFQGGVFPEILDEVINTARHGWYNHSRHRPVAYHFCSAIMRKDMDMIGGFDERYAYGVAFDDDEFIRTVEYMGMNIRIVDNPFVIHQYHTHFEFESKSAWQEPHALNQLLFNQGYNARIHRDYGRNKEAFDPVKFRESFIPKPQNRKPIKKKLTINKGEGVLNAFLRRLGER